MQNSLGLGAGGHAASFHDSEASQLAITGRFFCEGLAQGQKLVGFLPSALWESLDAALADFAKGKDVPAEARRIHWSTPEESYLHHGRFEPGKMIEKLMRAGEEARAEGFRGLRLTGDMSWASSGVAGGERLFEYEREADAILRDSTSTALCQYDRRRFAPDTPAKLAESHAFLALADEREGGCLADPILLLSDEGEILHANPAWQKRVSQLRPGNRPVNFNDCVACADAPRAHAVFPRPAGARAAFTLQSTGSGNAFPLRLSWKLRPAPTSYWWACATDPEAKAARFFSGRTPAAPVDSVGTLLFKVLDQCARLGWSKRSQQKMLLEVLSRLSREGELDLSEHLSYRWQIDARRFRLALVLGETKIQSWVFYSDGRA